MCDFRVPNYRCETSVWLITDVRLQLEIITDVRLQFEAITDVRLRFEAITDVRLQRRGVRVS